MLAAFETSCDDTCVAFLCPDSGKVLGHYAVSQIDAHRIYGGVVPEIAGRRHLKDLPALFVYALKDMGKAAGDIGEVAVTGAPGLIGSLLVGTHFAKSLAWGLGVPFTLVDHVEAHVLSVFLDHPEVSVPYLCLVASGGHSHFVLVEEIGKYRLIGRTLDDAIGEAYDKTAKVLGLAYPGGPVVDRLSYRNGEEGFEFPVPLGLGKSLDFSLSGLKTAVKYKAREEGVDAEEEIPVDVRTFERMKDEGRRKRILRIALGFQRTVERMILDRFETALKICPVKTLAFAGGVAANRGIRDRLAEMAGEKGLDLLVPAFAHCTDNASMIGKTAFLKPWEKIRDPKDYLGRQPSARGVFS